MAKQQLPVTEAARVDDEVGGIVERCAALARQLATGTVLTDEQYRALHVATTQLADALRHAGRHEKAE